MRTLFAITGGNAEISHDLRLAEGGRDDDLLRPGCSVIYELEAMGTLRKLLK